MRRTIEPEWLDALPAADPRAAASRRDLVRVNALMGNTAILARALVAAAPEPPRTLVDLGAGDGRFALRLARRLAPRWPSVQVILVDRVSAVSAATRAAISEAGWRAEVVAADAEDWCRSSSRPLEIVVANLFLHHFHDQALTSLVYAIAARTRLFAACEPRRSAPALVGSHLLGLIGCNDVTRHDAVASVRAGFSGREISSVWPRRAGWSLREGPAGWSSHLFLARALEPSGGRG